MPAISDDGYHPPGGQVLAVSPYILYNPTVTICASIFVLGSLGYVVKKLKAQREGSIGSRASMEEDATTEAWTIDRKNMDEGMQGNRSGMDERSDFPTEKKEGKRQLYAPPQPWVTVKMDSSPTSSSSPQLPGPFFSQMPAPTLREEALNSSPLSPFGFGVPPPSQPQEGEDEQYGDSTAREIAENVDVPRRRSYTKMVEGVEVQGEIVMGESWQRHTRVYGGGVCQACLESEMKMKESTR